MKPRVPGWVRRTLAVLAVLVLAGTRAEAGPIYKVVDLGDFTPVGIDDAGRVLGTRMGVDALGHPGPRSAVLWDGKTTTDLGPPGPDGWGSGGAISPGGTVTYSTADGDGSVTARVVKGRTTTDVGAVGPNAYAAGVNDAGAVVGSSRDGRAFLSTDGSTRRMVDLGTLGGKASAAAAINDKGVVVGQADTGGGAQHAFVSVPADGGGSRTDLGTLGGKSSAATAVNDKGQVVGTSNVPGAGSGPAGGTSPSPTTTGTGPGGSPSSGGTSSSSNGGTGAPSTSNTSTTTSTTTGTSATGATVPSGSAGTSPTGGQNAGASSGTSTTGGGTGTASGGGGSGGGTANGPTPPSGTSQANNAGTGGNAVGGSGLNAAGGTEATSPLGGTDATHAFFYQVGKMVDLGTLFGLQSSVATGINASGQVVGTASNTPWPFDGPRNGDWLGRAFVAEHGMIQDLNSRVPVSSGWVLQSAAAINDSGQIVGVGQHDGQRRVYLLTPTGDHDAVPAPEPTALALLGLAGVAAGARRLRGREVRDPRRP